MKKSLWIVLVLTVVCRVMAQEAGISELPVIPKSVFFQKQNGTFRLTAATVIVSDTQITNSTVTFLKETIAALTGYTFSENTPVASESIELHLDSLKVPQKEGYNLAISTKKAIITAHDPAGLFYGLQTFCQLLSQNPDKVYALPACIIRDYPRFSYRGMHLDVSRHLFPVAFIKKYIDLMALYKFNTFHWHLTDDQGWRIEIKKYPALQKVAAYRKETLIGHKKELPHVFDKKEYGGFYTQTEIKEIIDYAAKRHVTIIPEIEMPGHALAALAAYPEFGCTGGPYQTATFWGVFDEVYCAGNDSTFVFLENILDEVIALFPSAYIHIGGDECVKKRWKACPKCQHRMQTEHIKDESALQSYFIRRIGKYLQGKGKKIIGWDEILEGGLTPGATVMSWRGTEGGIQAIRQKHQAIMTPESHVYFDYYQSLFPEEPLAAAGYTSLQKVYSYNPVPNFINPEERKYIAGVQGNVWTEYMPTPEKAEFMVFPRMIALAEVAWTAQKQRNYPEFLKRLRIHQLLLSRLNVNYTESFDEITDSVAVTKNSLPYLYLKTALPGAIIRYTTDGSAPDKSSKVYTQAIAVSTTQKVKAAVFLDNTIKGRIYQKDFRISKATGKPVTFVSQPQGNFHPPDNLVAVNGISGTARYNTGEWFGFKGQDLKATIDLTQQETISKFGVNLLNYHWQRMWEPLELSFSVSDDGKTFRKVYQQNVFPVNGINIVEAVIEPLKARYIQIEARNKGIIPVGEYGEGNTAWLMADEFYVD